MKERRGGEKKRGKGSKKSKGKKYVEMKTGSRTEKRKTCDIYQLAARKL